MNIAEQSIRKSVTTWVMTVLLIVVGVSSFNSLSRLEDPEFTIKEAVIITPYPGASAAEVEEEVTNVIEQAVQEMGQLWRVESRSSRGLSMVNAVMRDQYGADRLPQVWDELRRKVRDNQRRLPPGAGPSLVNDDFGDVFGVFLSISGEGYSYKDIYEVAKVLQRELLRVDGVKKITLYGSQPEVIYVEMRRERMAELGISPADIYSALSAKNVSVDAGHVRMGREYISVNPTGAFESEEEFAELLISSRGGDSDRLIYLGDVVNIVRGYQEPPQNLLRVDGKSGIGLAVSTIAGGNVVTMGEGLEKRFRELTPELPLGLELDIIAMQPDAVSQSINGFLVNLAEAVVIVVLVLLVFMGLRSGLIIGGVLVITIMGTFILMNSYEVTLERISLGALVIALGMLVDNAIVVTDGMRVKMEQGVDALDAARDVVGQTGIPLLGATIVAITAFASIGTSDDATGEYCASLFSVILFSLSLSWLTAVTSTPLLCKTFLKTKKPKPGDVQKDPYGGAFYRAYRSVLSLAIRNRWVSIAVVVVLFVASVVGFGSVPQSFFPDSTRPQFYVDFWFPEGTHIDETMKEMERAEEYFRNVEGVTQVATMGGGSQVRFLLTYTPEKPYASFAQALVTVDDYRRIGDMAVKTQRDLDELFPESIINFRQFVLGPSTGGKIQLRIYGPDGEVLRGLAGKAERVLLEDPGTKAVRNEWRSKVKVLRPVIAEAQARRAGITRQDLSASIASGVEGYRVGVYREDDELLPIIARAPEQERIDLSNLNAVQVWSPAAQQMIPMGQVVTGFRTEFEDPHLWRRNRTKMIRIHADQLTGLASPVFRRVKPQIERALNVDVAQILGGAASTENIEIIDASTIAIEYDDLLPLKDMPGYYMAWGGEGEDSKKAQNALSQTLPVFFGLMVLIVLFLFNSIKKTLIIWLVVPLALIGVTAGLLGFGQPFGFMSLLGLLSLSGMLIKNAIVLIDEIDTQISSGKPPFQSIVDSGVSRLIPVLMAAITTILGMIPLLADAFFVAMAVTIMCGLGFATVLTLLVVPVLYAIFFRVPNPTT